MRQSLPVLLNGGRRHDGRNRDGPWYSCRSSSALRRHSPHHCNSDNLRLPQLSRSLSEPPPDSLPPAGSPLPDSLLAGFPLPGQLQADFPPPDSLRAGSPLPDSLMADFPAPRPCPDRNTPSRPHSRHGNSPSRCRLHPHPRRRHHNPSSPHVRTDDARQPGSPHTSKDRCPGLPG